MMRETQDRAGRGSPDAGQRDHLIKPIWKAAAMLTPDDLGRPVQVPGAGVIPKPGPMIEDRIKFCACQSLDIRKALDETLVVRNHGGDLGLLEHDL